MKIPRQSTTKKMRVHKFFVVSICTLYFISPLAKGQDAANLRTFYSIGRINAVSSFGGMFNIMPTAPSTVTGNYYFDDEILKKGLISVEGKDKPFGEFPMRYNLKSNELEVELKEGLRSLNLGQVSSFMWTDERGKESYFINLKDFNSNSVPIIGFAQVITSGKLSLLKKRRAIFQKTEFNPLEAEKADIDKIIKKEDFFFVKDSQAFLITKNKKDAIAFLGSIDTDQRIENFIIENGFNSKKELSLIQLTEFYNSIK